MATKSQQPEFIDEPSRSERPSWCTAHADPDWDGVGHWGDSTIVPIVVQWNGGEDRAEEVDVALHALGDECPRIVVTPVEGGRTRAVLDTASARRLADAVTAAIHALPA